MPNLRTQIDELLLKHVSKGFFNGKAFLDELMPLVEGEKCCPDRDRGRKLGSSCKCLCHQKEEIGVVAEKASENMHKEGDKAFFEYHSAHPLEGWKENFRKRFWEEYTSKDRVNLSWESLIDFISQTLAQERAKVVEIAEKLRKKNDNAKCGHRTPRDITANNYDCSDMHIGYAEALSDLLTDLSANTKSND